MSQAADRDRAIGELLEFAREHHPRWFENHAFKFALIHDFAVVSFYDEYTTAAGEGIRRFGADATFLVYEVTLWPLN